MQQEHYLVIGLGITGLSVVEYLVKQGKQVSVTDSRSEPPKLPEFKQKFPNVPIILGKFSVADNITTIVISPGVALTEPGLEPIQQRKLPVLGDIELFARVVDKPVLAVTGSNGKSTVTTLLGEMAVSAGIKAGVGGNLGMPALSLLADDQQMYILELSSFQLETLTSLKPLAVTVLNVSPDHMDRYADLIGYQQAKLRIYNNAEHVIFNREDLLTLPPESAANHAISFGLDAANNGNFGLILHAGAKWLSKGSQPLMPVTDLAMLGAHNVANALAALALGEAAGFSLPSMLKTLNNFHGLEHRCEQIANSNNILWVNDSKGTNVAATVTALHGLADAITGKWIIILGGIGKNADFSPLIEPVSKYCRAAILIGTEREQLWDILHEQIKCFIAEDLPAVISFAMRNAQPGDGVLLSPACASFDMFDNYVHRGEMFKQQVLQGIDIQHATTAN